jgi:hypothetical protein
MSAANLQIAIDNVDQQLADLTANPKPSYGIDGQSVSWGEHFRNLTQLRKELVEALIQAEGPWEQHIIGSS